MNKTHKLLCFLLCAVFLLPIKAFGEEHMHNMVEDFKAPSCTEEGYYNYYCSTCGYSPNGIQTLPKTDHTAEKWIPDKPATCVSFGREYARCSSCHALVYRSVAPNEKHNPKTIYAYPSTSRSDGEVLVKCTFCNQIIEKKVLKKIKSISLEKGKYVFNNKPYKPEVSAFDRKNNMISRNNFRVKYDKNTKSIGTHRVRIEFFGNYEGEEVLTYSIVPEGTCVKKLKAQRGAVEIKTDKLPKGTSGYQISYGTDKSLNTHKVITVNSKKQLSKRITKLKSKRKYYFRVRTFATVNNKKYYSKWSPIEGVKIK